MVTELHIPIIQSSLLAYKLSVGVQPCEDDGQLFTPLVRQYMSDPYESKYFVNVHQADISLHGKAPYMPEPLMKNPAPGLTLQVWSDSTCNTPIELEISVDFMGSLGRLFMRYRIVLAAFPLLIVALVVRKQFHEYDTRGSRAPSFWQQLEEINMQNCDRNIHNFHGSLGARARANTTNDVAYRFSSCP